jgi:hypothetical protein
MKSKELMIQTNLGGRGGFLLLPLGDLIYDRKVEESGSVCLECRYISGVGKVLRRSSGVMVNY